MQDALTKYLVKHGTPSFLLHSHSSSGPTGDSLLAQQVQARMIKSFTAMKLYPELVSGLGTSRAVTSNKVVLHLRHRSGTSHVCEAFAKYRHMHANPRWKTFLLGGTRRRGCQLQTLERLKPLHSG